MLKLQPFDLSNVPSGMERFVYDEECRRGSVNCSENVYMLVLALRWVLYEYHVAEWDNSGYVTWKVFWAPKDEYGLATDIYLFRDHVEHFDGEDYYVAEELAYLKLATVHCDHSGRGDIRSIRIEGGPYGYTLLDDVAGVCRLLEDAFGRDKRIGDIFPERRDNCLIMEEYHDGIHERVTVTWQLNEYRYAICNLRLEYAEQDSYLT